MAVALWPVVPPSGSAPAADPGAANVTGRRGVCVEGALPWQPRWAARSQPLPRRPGQVLRSYVCVLALRQRLGLFSPLAAMALTLAQNAEKRKFRITTGAFNGPEVVRGSPPEARNLLFSPS